jgi:hypothetical protein
METFTFQTKTSGCDWAINTLDISAFHTYKVVLSGGSATLYIDGAAQATKACTGIFTFRWIGVGHPTSAYRFGGTIDYFKIKNSL